MSTNLKRRGVAALAVVSVAGIALAGCAGADPEEEAATGEVGGEVRMLVNITDNLTQEKWEALVAPFEEETGVTVRIEGPTGQSVAESLPSMLAAGTAPDVIESVFPTAETAGEVLDLTDFEWVADTPMVDTYSSDGRTSVVGVGTQAQSLLWYNADLFAAAGITETPRTWEELDAALAALKDHGVAHPIGFASEWATGVQTQELWHPQQNIDTPDWQKAVADGESTLGEQFEPMFEHISGWIDAGYTTAEDVATDSGTQEANFIAGNVGIYPMGAWFASTLSAGAPDFEVGVFSPPVDDDAEFPGPMGATLAFPYMVWSGSSNIASAAALVEYLATDPDAIAEQARLDAFSRPGMDVASDDYTAAVQEVVDAAPSLVVPGNTTVGDLALPVAGFNAKLTELVQSLWQGRAAGDVAETLTTWYEAERTN